MPLQTSLSAFDIVNTSSAVNKTVTLPFAVEIIRILVASIYLSSS